MTRYYQKKKKKKENLGMIRVADKKKENPWYDSKLHLVARLEWTYPFIPRSTLIHRARTI